jgi:predicted N-acetyltransferase YhbS
MADALTLHAFANEWHIETESVNDASERELLLDRVMGYERFLKSSENLRRERNPSDFLALVARSIRGDISGTVRLWDVFAGNVDALLLGPLAVAPECSGMGIGSALMVEAISRAEMLGHGAILLVGDPGYYARFGFTSRSTQRLDMPGHFERHRLLGLELSPGWLRSASGLISPRDGSASIRAAA